MAPRLREKGNTVGMLKLGVPDVEFVVSMAQAVIRQAEQRADGYEAVVKLLFQTVVAFLSTKYEQTESTVSQNLGLIAAAYHYMKRICLRISLLQGLRNPFRSLRVIWSGCSAVTAGRPRWNI